MNHVILAHYGLHMQFTGNCTELKKSMSYFLANVVVIVADRTVDLCGCQEKMSSE